MLNDAMHVNSYRKLLAKKVSRKPPRTYTKTEAESFIEEGNIYQSLIDSYGWKLLKEQFLDVIGNTDRLLQYSGMKHKLQREAIRASVIRELYAFIQSKLDKRDVLQQKEGEL